MAQSQDARALSEGELKSIFDSKFPRHKKLGWGPLLRRKYGYYSPDDHYEAMLTRLITEGCNWADLGCGRDIFPSNIDLGKILAQRANHVLGIDPDENINENPYISEAFQGTVDQYAGKPGFFDVVTLRMVAEHVQQPGETISSLHRMVRTGGTVVLLTPHKWAPLSLMARWTPFWLHHPLKRFFWGTEKQDTFPVAFKMNTHRELIRIFGNSGFNPVYYRLLHDCSVFSRFKFLNRIELLASSACRRLHLPYPECCIMAVFSKA